MGSKRRTEKDFSVVNIKEPYRSMLDELCTASMRTMTAELHYLISKARAELSSGTATQIKG